MSEALLQRGMMRGHWGMVTAIATPIDNSNRMASSSRDKSIILWHIIREGTTYGVPLRRLTGHTHFVQDIVLSSDCQFAVSASYDCELRLWDLTEGVTVSQFVGHTKDILSVALSVDNRHIVSASRDHTIKLWNTIGECKNTLHGDDNSHSDWVSCVKFIPNTTRPTIVSSSWDCTVKNWDLKDSKVRFTLRGHVGYVNTVTVSSDGSLCASGGKDGVVLLWEMSNGNRVRSLNVGSIIHALCFSPNRYWLCIASEGGVKVWDLDSKCTVQDIKVDPRAEPSKAVLLPIIGILLNQIIYCTSLSWSADGSTLFCGCSDGVIRVWEALRW